MRKVIANLDGQRVDRIDWNAIHGNVVSEFQRQVDDIIAGGGRFVIGGFDMALTGPSEPKQIVVTLGVAVGGEILADTSVADGQLLSEGLPSNVFDFAGLATGTYSVWVRFEYVAGATANRAYLADVAGVGRERTQPTETRDVPGWQLTATLEGTDPDPGDAWIRIGRVAYSGANLVEGDLIEAREMLFEGQGDADGWTFPDFDRTDDRAAAPITTLKAWIWAVAKRLEDLGGRGWHSALGFGENVRSASSAITVCCDASQASTAHIALNAAGAVAGLTLLATSPGGSNADRRTVVEFLPDPDGARAELDVNVTSLSVIAAAAVRRVWRGAVNIRRTAGANPLIQALNFIGLFSGIHFTAAAGGPRLFSGNGPNDDLTFEGCTFYGADSITTVALFEARNTSAGARYRFVNCTFRLESGSTDDHVVVSAAADVVFDGCTFTGGRYGVHLAAAPARLLIRGCTFTDMDKGVTGVAGAEATTIMGSTFTDMVTARVDVAAGVGPTLYMSAGASNSVGAANNALIVGGAVVADHVRSQDAALYLDTADQGAGGRRIFVESALLEFPRLTGRDRLGGLLAALFLYLHASGRRVMFGSSDGGKGTGLRFDTGAGAEPERLAATRIESDGLGGEVEAFDVDFHAHRLLLGLSAIESRAWLTRHTTPKAWVCFAVSEDFDPDFVQVTYATPDGQVLTGTWHKDADNGDAHYLVLAGLNGVSAGGRCLLMAQAAAGIGPVNRNADPISPGGGVWDKTSGRVMDCDVQHDGLSDDAVIVPFMREPDGTRVYFTGDEWHGAGPDGGYAMPLHYQVSVVIFGGGGDEFVNGGGDEF